MIFTGALYENDYITLLLVEYKGIQPSPENHFAVEKTVSTQGQLTRFFQTLTYHVVIIIR